jgi:hypothetical protein
MSQKSAEQGRHNSTFSREKSRSGADLQNGGFFVQLRNQFLACRNEARNSSPVCH